MNHPMNWTTLLIFLAVHAAFFIFRQMSLVSSDAAKQFLRKGVVVIDFRGPDEYASGHLPGTVNVPLGELSGRISVSVTRSTTMKRWCRCRSVGV